MRAALSRAYRLTRYEAAGIEVLIGRRSVAMDRLLAAHRCRSGVLVTAWNPFSRRMPDGWNRRMQTRLAQVARRWPQAPGEGRWRRWREVHLLLFAASAPALRLARLFRQNAVVIVRIGHPARLVSISAIEQAQLVRPRRQPA
jgi:hypothetical protein